MADYRFWKPIIDWIAAFLLIVLLSPLLVILYLICAADTGDSGLFIQDRVGRYGTLFKIYKFRTIASATRRISKTGKFMRRYKLDELPQLFNILKGEMSFVGPRPDIPGYYDKLEGEDRKVLELRPGLTSEAGIKYRNEDALLAAQSNPLKYNDEVLFPDKIELNKEYYRKLSAKEDLRLLIKTLTTLMR